MTTTPPTLTIRIEVVVMDAAPGSGGANASSEPDLAVYADAAVVGGPPRDRATPLFGGAGSPRRLSGLRRSPVATSWGVPERPARLRSTRAAVLGVAAVVGLVSAVLVLAPDGDASHATAAPQPPAAEAAAVATSAPLPPQVTRGGEAPDSSTVEAASCGTLAVWPAGAKLAVGIGPP